jgi:S-adenosylmethionine-diacylglycerol 3-amino-3-carboxypropyl transferase
LIAIDKRPDQVFNLELKAAAMDAFDYGGFLAFLGIAEAPDRLEQYHVVRPSLSQAARRYWDNRRPLIDAGVFYAGRTEVALLRFMKRLKARGFMRWAEPLFQATSLEAQQALLEAQRTRVDRGLLWWKLFCSPLVIYPLTQDPGFLRSTEKSVGAYLVHRLINYASLNLVRESYLLRLVYDCGISPASPLVPYLTRNGFDLVRKNLDRMEIQCVDLRDFATRSRIPGTIKWSLSDVSCWMNEQRYQDLLRSVSQCGVPGSRFCLRHFAARREFPGDLRRRAVRLEDLCHQLDRQDSSAIDRVEVGMGVRDG